MKKSIKRKRVVRGERTSDGHWIGIDTKYNPEGKIVIKDKNDKVIALQG